ncbi:hypothetical protein VD0002_g7766 [Verticillium dahliae]|uniref:CoxI translation protein CYA5 n=2 Tax=Verticillium dahliae TaxID=27337 RepID=G2WSB1_VERDV|nr:coxI translation protein CYA5 [Verticillium dahliae VdLs.17]KAF3350563.1 3'(2'),5'-bisphosphate nucleotidase [Verticillium dahliae VDG2]KAH6710230.1 coxI translation protein CYA5 [Verticillium dahliae]EGY13762.1 coxI translation protein CYA5 [Verticillium dahliae VdLs.17]PNH34368.1 hypothetical protein BJF96_g2418 [Verticillium dahliae]PNH50291.1 hypothetical protein VD0003_g6880 [Verticillium dahliae]
MLERTAAALEPCTFQRSLPSSVRARRNLHTGFWQHGAAPLDLASLWAPNGHDTQGMREPVASSHTPDRLVASAFLLDFLYPRGTVAFLRRLTPASATSSAQRQPQQGTTRLFTSASHDAHAAPEPADIFEHGAPSTASPSAQTIAPVANHTKYAEQYDGQHVAAAADAQPELMRELMARKDAEYFGQIWDLWRQLNTQRRADLRPEVIAYFHRSTSAANADRVLALFSEMDPSSWTPPILTAAVAAELRQGDVKRALKIYHTALKERELVGGLGHLLAHAFRHSAWDLIREIWTPYRHLFAAKGVQAGDLSPLLAVPDLGTQVLAFMENIKAFEGLPDLSPKAKPKQGRRNRPRSAPSDAEATDGLVRLLREASKRALVQPCKPDEALHLLQVISHSEWYSIYLNKAVERGQEEHMAEIYREFRKLSKHINWRILHGMFDVFYPHDVAGLEQVYEDFHRSYGKLDQWGFRKYLKFYASRGDVRSTKRLWSEYVAKGHHKGIMKDPETFNHVLNAYSNRGIPEDTRQVFDDLTVKYNVTPDVVSWNILLKTYVRADRYDDAIQAFEDLSESVAPDSVSFGTIMAMTGGKGDLARTESFFEQAQELKVEVDAAIVYGLVEAYCQNDRFHEAKLACISATRKGVQGDNAYFWNCLIKYQSHRRNLGGAYRTMDLMAEHGVKWNAVTYDLALQSLLYTKQTDHAYQLLLSTLEDKSFPVTEQHFATVMSSALRTGQPRKVEAIRAAMEKKGYPMSMETSIATVDALLKQQSTARRGEEGDVKRVALTPEKAHELGKSLVDYFQRVLQSQYKDPIMDSGSDRWMMRQPGDKNLIGSYARVVQRAMVVLAQSGDFASVHEILDLYSKAMLGGSNHTASTPLPLVDTMMLANFLDNKHDRVKEAWEVAWQKALAQGRPKTYKKPGILPSHRYDLCGPVHSMQRVLAAEKDHQGLTDLVEKVTSAGFKLDSRNWNYICRALVEMSQWEQACDYCENMLMTGWRGWAPHRRGHSKPKTLPIEVRRRGNAPRWLRPDGITLNLLRDQYVVLKSEAPWSSTIEAQLHRVQEKCPRLWRAFLSKEESRKTVESELP